MRAWSVDNSTRTVRKQARMWAKQEMERLALRRKLRKLGWVK